MDEVIKAIDRNYSKQTSKWLRYLDFEYKRKEILIKVSRFGSFLFWLINGLAVAGIMVLSIKELLLLNSIAASVLAFAIAVSGLYWCFKCAEQMFKPSLKINKVPVAKEIGK